MTGSAAPKLAAGAYDWIIVGAGFSGAVLAERIASELHERVLVVERRGHVGGNAYDYRDDATGLLVHKYGPHVFHTNSDKVWAYLSRFTDWRPYVHRARAVIDGRAVPLPFNFEAIETTFEPAHAARLIARLSAEFGPDGKAAVLNLRRHADAEIRSFADYVYDKVFHNYTLKQWDLSPQQLDPSVMARVPVRLSYDDCYFQDRYQALPSEGYTRMFERLLAHERISVLLDTPFSEAITTEHPDARVIYTGPIDAYFDYRHGELPYRSLRFVKREAEAEFVQPVGQMNYPNDFEYTRISEMKHLTGEKSERTILLEEYPEPYVRGRNEPYYPIPAPHTDDLVRPYFEDVKGLAGSVWFTGRLADYRYYNMDQACARSLTLFEKEIGRL